MSKIPLYCFFFLVAIAVPAGHGSETIVPWHETKADVRQVFEIRPSGPSIDPVAEIPVSKSLSKSLLKNPEGSLRFINPKTPGEVLSFFEENAKYFVHLKGNLSSDEPGKVIAYRGKELAASPVLPKKPVFFDDYASIHKKTPWDFDNGDFSSITGFSNVSRDAVSVENGWLKIPIEHRDVYLIYGLMWGSEEHEKNLKIDSNVYRYLDIRVRQSCEESAWRIYLTDKKGQYKRIDFVVYGKEPQEFHFDLREIFSNFWDGREFRALRIDPVKNMTGQVAEIDYIRLLPSPPDIVVGPVLSRAAVESRQKVQKIEVDVPDKTIAGQKTFLTLIAKDRDGNPLPPDSSVTVVTESESSLIGTARTEKDERRRAALAPICAAGDATWIVGLADDLGRPFRSVSGKILVEPAETVAYKLTGREFVDVDEKQPIPLEIIGVDRFGNEIPCNVQKPHWTVENGSLVDSPDVPLQGKALIKIRVSEKPLEKSRFVLTDEHGRSGSFTVTSVAYRNNTVRLNENGYLLETDGTLCFPVGGLYANWPHSPPDKDGKIHRALDLFPCHEVPYTNGFPWPEEVEKKVVAYLEHCRSHGINALRLMLRNMDQVGRVDPIQLKATLHYFDLARKYDIRFNVVLFEDYDKSPYVNQVMLRKIIRPNYTEEELKNLPPHRARFLIDEKILKGVEMRYTDPDVLECQKDYMRELIPILAGREEVLNYEFENEMHVDPGDWCLKTKDFIRLIDPHTLMLGNPHPMVWPISLDWRGNPADMVAYHPYSSGISVQADAGASYLVRGKWTAQSRLPFNTGEGGLYDKIPNETNEMNERARAARDQAWTLVTVGGNGFMYWTVMHEGVIAEFGKIAPALEAIEIDLKNLKRRRPEAALVMPPRGNEEISWATGNASANRQATILCKRLMELGIDFDTPPKGEESDYSVSWDVLTTKPEEIVLSDSVRPTVGQPGKGWDVSTILSQDGRSAIVYLRNVVGGIKDFGTKEKPCFCRDVHSGMATLKLECPDHWTSIVAYDLDTKQRIEMKADENGILTFTDTSSDFVIGLQSQK